MTVSWQTDFCCDDKVLLSHSGLAVFIHITKLPGKLLLRMHIHNLRTMLVNTLARYYSELIGAHTVAH